MIKSLLLVFILGITNSFAQGINRNFIPNSLKEDKVFNEDGRIVASHPEPEGGLAKFYSFINKKLKYPNDAKRKGIEGRV